MIRDTAITKYFFLLNDSTTQGDFRYTNFDFVHFRHYKYNICIGTRVLTFISTSDKHLEFYIIYCRILARLY